MKFLVIWIFAMLILGFVLIKLTLKRNQRIANEQKEGFIEIQQEEINVIEEDK